MLANSCQTLLTHPEEKEQHGHSIGALFLTTCWMKSNIHWRFLHSFIRQLLRKTSGSLWLLGCSTVFTSHSVTLALHHFTLGRKPTIGLCVQESRERLPTVQYAEVGESRSDSTMWTTKPKQWAERGWNCQVLQMLPTICGICNSYSPISYYTVLWFNLNIKMIA